MDVFRRMDSLWKAFALPAFLRRTRFLVLFVWILLGSSSGLLALGTYAEGYAVVQLTRLEESGLMFSSYEGTLKIASYDEKEKCNEKDYLCYTPIAIEQPFSVRPENKKLVGFLKDNEGREMLVKYRIHRVEPAALSSSFELLEAMPWADNPADDMDTKFGIKKSGNLRSFTVFGRILRFDYRGTVIGTWEGLYLDAKRRKVHPFSVTDKRMADYIYKAIKSRRNFYMAVSVAYVATMRDSDHDIFAIDYKKAPR